MVYTLNYNNNFLHNGAAMINQSKWVGLSIILFSSITLSAMDNMERIDKAIANIEYKRSQLQNDLQYISAGSGLAYASNKKTYDEEISTLNKKIKRLEKLKNQTYSLFSKL